MVDNSRPELVVNNKFNPLQQSNNTRISSSLLVDTTTSNVAVNDTFKLWKHRPSSNVATTDKILVPTLSNTIPIMPLISDLNIWHDLFEGQHLWQKIHTCKSLCWLHLNAIFSTIHFISVLGWGHHSFKLNIFVKTLGGWCKLVLRMPLMCWLIWQSILISHTWNMTMI